ncbi:aldo/keto reductase [Caballeronia ptereochthonis]|uniref:Aldo/keto reductase n=1 Tax=Caballeronia ptereochthonis TaxID=1777144 RepID=A0A158D0Q4_9BURK|nr:aldo/keto reductase [Caballeronia ptereochthonis]SAK88158.1 aldo/keto reductase [Caballeronia ptereochthonis]
MKYRSIGRTDLKVSEIGFGCGGNAGLMVRGSFDEQLRIVEAALEAGINYFDVAPDYIDAEANLGRVLHALGARPLLNSKVEIRAGNLDDIAAHVVRSAESSLKELGVDHLDVLQVHNAPVAGSRAPAGSDYHTLGVQHFLGPRGALEGLRRLLDAGKVRHVGFVCRGNDAPYVRELLATGMFGMLNVPYTLLNPSAGMVLPANLEVDKDGGAVLDDARNAGAGAAVYSVLARGFLSDQSVAGEAHHPLARDISANATDAGKMREKAARVSFLARETGISLAQAAFRFVLAHSGVTTALGGFSSMQQLKELCAVSGMGPFPDELNARLHLVWQSNFAGMAS